MSRTIAHFGTFDVPNYGDLLFPLILEKRLGHLVDRFIHVSPRGGPAVWSDCVPSQSCQEFMQLQPEIDGLVVGGGNIVHCSPTLLDAYQNLPFSGEFAYPSLWLNPSKISADKNIPLCWNGSGVAQPFAPAVSSLARWACSGVEYLSVRDSTSQMWLQEAGVSSPIHVIPDTALEISELWPAETLISNYELAFKDRQRSVPKRTVVFHLNRRFLGEPISVIAERLDEICKVFEATPILIALGPCHGDSELQIGVGQLMKTRPLVIAQPCSLKEIAACIAHSVAYLGSSLHGLITASSYGRPNIAVVSSQPGTRHKFVGFLEQFQLNHWIVDSWATAETQAGPLLQAVPSHWERILATAKPHLDQHWARTASLLTESTEAHPSPRHGAQKKRVLTSLKRMLAKEGIEGSPLQLLVRPHSKRYLGHQLKVRADSEKFRAHNEELESVRIALKESKDRVDALEQNVKSDKKQFVSKEAELKSRILEESRIRATQSVKLRAARRSLIQTKERLQIEIEERRKLKSDFQERIREVNSAWKSALLELGEIEESLDRKESELKEARSARKISDEKSRTMVSELQFELDKLRNELEVAESELQNTNSEISSLNDRLTNAAKFPHHSDGTASAKHPISKTENVAHDVMFVQVELTHATAQRTLDPIRSALCDEQQQPDPAVENDGDSSHVDNPTQWTLLTVVHGGGGGTIQAVMDLARNASSGGKNFLLRTNLSHWDVQAINGDETTILKTFRFDKEWRFDETLDPQRIAALEWITDKCGPTMVHVRHLIGNGPELIHFFDRLEIPVLFSFHDFYTVCPTIHLLDDHGEHCGGNCTSSDTDCQPTRHWFRPPLPRLKRDYVFVHRERIQEALQRCAALITTSDSTREILQRVFPALSSQPWIRIEHGRDLERRQYAHAPSADCRCRILCLGNLERIKGSDLITKLLELDRQRGPRFEFHFVGERAHYFRPENVGGICHGRYTINQLPEIIHAIRPSFSLIASLWETYCHTLTESWAFGLPVVAAANGALKERINEHGGGILIPHRDAESWYSELLRLANSADLYANLVDEVARIPLSKVSVMSRHYLELYDKIHRQYDSNRRVAKQAAALVLQNRRLRTQLHNANETQNRALAKAKSDNIKAKNLLNQRDHDLDYLKVIMSVRDAVENVVPAGANVVVISKGDEQMLRMGPRTCRHFPADEAGNYLGYHPADGAEAVALLEQDAHDGVDYLIVPATSLWWIDHYQEFGNHVTEQAECLFQSPDCRIYSLAKTSLSTRTKFLIKSIKLAWSAGNRDRKQQQDASVEVDYPKLVEGVVRAVNQTVPTDSVVTVISKGDNSILQFKHIRGWHFPQTNQGVYAGYYPKSDKEAIRHLEDQRDLGAQYLVVPSTYSWWLDHYTKLRRHLARRYERRYQDDLCTIYNLNTNGTHSFWKRIRTSLVGPTRSKEVHAPHSSQHGDNGSSKILPTFNPFGPDARPLDGRLITVVVPIYNAFDDVKFCLTSLTRHNRHPHQLLLIDDCSPDSRIWPLLESFAKRHKHIRLLRNPENMGFTRTINLGCQTAPGDIVMLNSDTKVTKNWLEKIDACACSTRNVGTVTPVSNAAGAFSVPVNNSINKIPTGVSVDDMGKLVERLSHRVRPSVPTGNGFCMYISRNLMNVIGFFDDESFPRGYGEENDFCMRAKAKGFLNVIDDSTFVYHHLSASFGENRNRLIKQSRETLRALHPTYKSEVTQWLKNDPLDGLREKLVTTLQDKNGPNTQSPSEKPCLLYVIHDGKGGTPLTNADLIRGVTEEYQCLLLTTGLDYWTLFDCFEGTFRPLRKYRFSKQWQLTDTMTDERIRVLEEIKTDYGVGMVHIRHLLGNGPETIHVFSKSNVPVLFSFHDYYTVCPTIQLIDRDGVYCSGKCTSTEDDCQLVPSWFRGTQPKLKNEYVHTHRKKMQAALAKCSFLITTCQSAKEVFQQSFPNALQNEIRVIEHGRDIRRKMLATFPSEKEPTRVICLGNLDQAKGNQTIMALLSLNKRAGTPFEFHFLGQHASNFKPSESGGVYHGTYVREELPEILGKIRPSFSLIASIWAETYCHTLTESWAMGLPVFASHFGALKERVQKHGGGWLIDPNHPESCFKKMLEIRNSSESYSNALKEIERTPDRSTSAMVEDYLQLYAVCLNKKRH